MGLLLHKIVSDLDGHQGVANQLEGQLGHLLCVEALRADHCAVFVPDQLEAAMLVGPVKPQVGIRLLKTIGKVTLNG